MTRRDWQEKLRLLKESSERYHAALQERGNPENLAVIDEYNSLLSELSANLSLFNVDDQAFIVKAKLPEKLRQFKEISIKYNTFLHGRENPDDDLSVVGNSFNSLLTELLSNLSLFNPEDRAASKTQKSVCISLKFVAISLEQETRPIQDRAQSPVQLFPQVQNCPLPLHQKLQPHRWVTPRPKRQQPLIRGRKRPEFGS